MKYKKFDWENCKKIHSPARFKYLQENHDKVISFEEYSKAMLELVKPFTLKNRSKKFCPSNLGRGYKNFKNKFGFFIGKQNLI